MMSRAEPRRALATGIASVHIGLADYDRAFEWLPIRDREGVPVGAIDLSTHVSDCTPNNIEDVISLAPQN